MHTMRRLPVSLPVNLATLSMFSFHSRGLNPPHRVKSVSITTFTDEELAKLKNGGNEVCEEPS